MLIIVLNQPVQYYIIDEFDAHAASRANLAKSLLLIVGDKEDEDKKDYER